MLAHAYPTHCWKPKSEETEQVMEASDDACQPSDIVAAEIDQLAKPVDDLTEDGAETANVTPAAETQPSVEVPVACSTGRSAKADAKHDTQQIVKRALCVGTIRLYCLATDRVILLCSFV